MCGEEIIERRKKADKRCLDVLSRAAIIAVYDYQGNAVRIRKDNLVNALPVDIDDERLFDKIIGETSENIKRRAEILDELGK